MKFFRIFSYLFVLILVVLGLTFAATNATPVTIHYYLGSATVSLSLMLVYALGIGILLGAVTTIFPLFKLKRENRSLKSQVRQLQKATETK